MTDWNFKSNFYYHASRRLAYCMHYNWIIILKMKQSISEKKVACSEKDYAETDRSKETPFSRQPVYQNCLQEPQDPG